MTIHPFSPKGREQALERMAEQSFDILIIGGGITGAGIARDAALRGLTVALVEKEDFGYGTSSRSSKLIHGGVRYLANGEVNMVRESAGERKVLKTIAPHLVHPLPFVFPLYKGDSGTKYKTGFYIFDKLAGASKEDSHQSLTAGEVREYAPQLRDPLKGGFVYSEYVTEDARFTVMNALSAAEHGACVANYAKVVRIRSDEHDHVCGATVQDTLSGQTFDVKATMTINATGPWAQQTLEDNGLTAPKNLLLSKGIHLIFSASKLPITGAVALKSESGKEGFAIRRWNFVYVGTTDVPHDEIIDAPIADNEAVGELLAMTQNCFPSSQLTKADILGTWAGLRPLISEEGKSARDTSRHDEVWKNKEGLLTVAGGKLTTYRNMADRVLQEVAKNTGKDYGDNRRTAEIPLPGADIGGNFSAFKKDMQTTLSTYQIPEETAERLTWLYGSALNDLIQYGREDAVWMEPLAENIPAIKGEIRLAVEKEMAHSLIDVFDRRTALLLFGNGLSQEAVEEAAGIMSERLGWDKEEKERQVKAYTDVVNSHRVDVKKPASL